MILGIPWLRKHNPYIDWKKGTISWNNPDWKKRFRDVHELQNIEEFNSKVYKLNTKTSASQRLEMNEKQGKQKNPKEIVPPEFHDYITLFNEGKSERYPLARV